MAAPPANQPRRGYPRTFGGLVGALIATLGVIAFVYGLTWFQRSGQPNPTPTVSYRSALEGARSQAPFHVLAPQPPPPGLRATSVDWSGPGPRASWQLGFLTPQNRFIGLYQGNGPSGDFVDASTPARQDSGQVRIGGESWRVLTDPGQQETALVRTSDGVTVVVTGTAARDQLVQFAGRLR